MKLKVSLDERYYGVKDGYTMADVVVKDGELYLYFPALERPYQKLRLGHGSKVHVVKLDTSEAYLVPNE